MADDLDTYDPVRGPARERIDAEELADPDDRASVILDRRRRRPRYFDDRFLTARDLTRGQQYTLLRQADLAQLSGGGVVRGLDVAPNGNGTQLRIDAGIGIARTGESIVIRKPTVVEVAKLRVVEPNSRTTQLVATNAAMAPGTGMYVLVAHPVEHSRSAALSFPQANTTTAALVDTEIVEGTWFTLTPLPSAGNKDVVGRGRARLAREIFVGGFSPELSADAVALAVVGIVNARVQWVDEALAGRSVGADEVVGFGLQPRKTRLAYQAQFTRHLGDELDRRRSAGLPDGLAAVEAFAALPPVGPLPRGAVDVTTTEVRQSFFPREVYVEMAIMPEDELSALLSEGLVRAPIDLEAGGAALEGVAVLIVVPVRRSIFDQLTPRMAGVYRAPALAATGRELVKARPIDALTVLRRKSEPAASSDPLPLDLEAWRKSVEMAPQLWYVRRPQFATTSVVVPRSAPADEANDPSELLGPAASEALADAGEVDRFNHLFSSSSLEALAAADELLSLAYLAGADGPQDQFSPANQTSVYVSGIMGELAYLARRPRSSQTIDPADIPTSPVFTDIETGDRLRLRSIEVGDVEWVRPRFELPGLGDALAGLMFRDPALRSVLASAAVVPELAFWVSSSANNGVADSRRAAIAGRAAAAQITQLRELSAGISLEILDNEPPPEEVPVEDSQLFPLVEDLEQLALLYTVWPPSGATFRAELDGIAGHLESSGRLLTISVLVKLIVVGYALDVVEDEELVTAVLDALDVVDDNVEFDSPNQDTGEILGLDEHPERDAALASAAEVSKAVASDAQQRLEDFGFNDKGHRLLAIATASIKYEHISAILETSDGKMGSFVEVANQATEARSLSSMYEALEALGINLP